MSKRDSDHAECRGAHVAQGLMGNTRFNASVFVRMHLVFCGLVRVELLLLAARRARCLTG